MERTGKKEYLGDGVYLLDDGYQLWLSTNTTLFGDNGIALDRDVFQRLIELGTQRFADIREGVKK